MSNCDDSDQTSQFVRSKHLGSNCLQKVSVDDKWSLVVIHIYSNKKETSDFHGTVSFDPVKMSQQK